MSDDTGQFQPNATKRSRPVISCLECRRKKSKCDRTHPCQQCIKAGRPGRCQYQPGQDPESNVGYSHAVSNKRPRPDSPVAGDVIEALQERNGADNLFPPPTRRGIIEELQERVAKLEKAVLGDARGHDGSVAYHSPPDVPKPAVAIDRIEPPLKINQINFHVSTRFLTAYKFS